MLLGNFEVFETLLITLTLLALHREFGVFGSATDDEITETICKKHYRRTASRYVSYRERYNPYPWNTIQLTKWNYRWETFVELALIDVCCDGYEPLPTANILICIPVCKSSCNNGKCYKPDVCICDAGYQELTNKSTGYITCEPHCPSGCLGGRCIAPGTCTCDAGYLQSNNAGSCKASCSAVGGGGPSDCGNNASCTAPNKCQCDNGYIPVTNSSSSGGSETLIHDDIQTTGRAGWISLENIEKPTFNASDVTCKPSCEPECGQNSTCIAPNDCQCSPGYRNTSLMTHQTSNNSLCLPVCEKECVNGFCGYPNKCICHSGYKPDVRSYDDSICEPICKDDCINGICTLPDHCECNYGYEKLSTRAGLNESALTNVCAPVCPGQCLNGCCVAPDYCLCNPGYVITLVYPNETITDVADGIDSIGSISLPAQQSCQPLCKPSCPGGSLCTAPNQCQLQPDHHQDLNEFANNGTQNINSTEYCGGNGVFNSKNGSCSCHYGWTGSRCTEPFICAVVFSNDNKTEEDTILQSVVVDHNGMVRMNYDINSGDSNRNPNWESLKCKERCRISILSSENLNNDVMRCHRVELFNGTSDLLSSEILQSEFLKGENKTVICFMNVGSSCNVEESKIVTGRAGVIVGYFFLFVLVIGLGLVSIYFIHRKITRMRAIRAVRRINAMREQAEATESLYATDDSSHL